MSDCEDGVHDKTNCKILIPIDLVKTANRCFIFPETTVAAAILLVCIHLFSKLLNDISDQISIIDV